jgi:hypothetical protein
MVLYVNTKNADAINRITGYIADKMIQQLPLDIVHPEKYEAVASYQQIAFKPLIRRLPEQTIKKFANIVLLKS